MVFESLSMRRLVIASHNPGKVREIGELLAPYGVETVSAGELGIPEPPETGTTFAENARIKALVCAEASGLPALSDDSGFAVDALGGKPGVHAADWAELPRSEQLWSGERRDFRMAMWHVHALMREAGVQPGSAQAAARFVCALCIAEPDGQTRIYEGECAGRVVWPPRGTRGFGYDPIFQAEGDAYTFGEIAPAEKHAKSHRARAFGKLVAAEFGGLD